MVLRLQLTSRAILQVILQVPGKSVGREKNLYFTQTSGAYKSELDIY